MDAEAVPEGLFITFEGLDGSGKSTQLELLASDLRAAGYDVVATREPGGTRVGEAIREVLLSPAHSEMTARAEALLYAASRAQLVEQTVRPALARGCIVLCDRYVDSSIAYQGFGRELGLDDVLTLNVWGTECLFPQLTLFYTAPEEVRTARGRQEADRLETETAEFFARVRAGYEHMAEVHSHRIKVIDATGTVAEVYERTKAVVEEELGLFGASRAE